ncbi:HAD family hydrolase [Alicyclobacillus sp.]|uniref:HAD family hydrolase n=1 Tax=Alicyclobacillus sp. TaxID=61169 RepID=UPI0025BE95E4|nr:HAD family hydrolase [Alicyclobacillus sp.]MCL6516547.1 HAD family hydrolase [Alicyclobacillus sp.]
MTRIRAVFLDIDGTLVHNGVLMESAVDAILRLRRHPDLRVALCTGRSILHTVPLQHRLGVTSAVYFNGGLAVDGDTTVRRSPMEADVVRRLVAWQAEFHLPVIWHTVDAALITRPVPERHRPMMEAFNFPELKTVRESELTDDPPEVYQVNVFATAHWDQKLQNDFPECLLYRWHAEGLDLQKRGCDKVLGAKALLATWQIPPEEALHIGDGGNDVGMFRGLGLGIAMGNAPQEVQEQADLVTAPVHEDGVYRALERAGLI